MKRLAAVCVLFALPLVALGQEVVLPPTVAGQPGDFVIVTAQTDGKTVQWYSPDAGLKLFPAELLRDTKTAIVFAAQPGKYRLVAWGAKGDVPGRPAVCVVVIDGAVQPPPVPPDPIKPPPVPVPLAKAWVVVIEETADATAKRGAYFRDPALAAFVQGKGWKVRVADKDVRDAAGQQPADLAPYLKAAQGKALPWLFVVGSDGAVAFQGALPQAPAELVTLLRKLGG